ncbi:hypothetical protein Tco_0010314 [Tanacetum coccineum]
MGCSSSQPRTEPTMSPINAFQSKIFATSPTKKKKSTRNLQKRSVQSDDAPLQIAWTTKEDIASVGGSKRHKSSGSSSFNTKSGDASINLNTNIGDNDEDEVQEIRRPGGRDKARAVGKNKRSKASRLETMNDDALARLMVTEMTAAEVEQREAFIEIKKRRWNVVNKRLQLRGIDNKKKT